MFILLFWIIISFGVNFVLIGNIGFWEIESLVIKLLGVEVIVDDV